MNAFINNIPIAVLRLISLGVLHYTERATDANAVRTHELMGWTAWNYAAVTGDLDSAYVARYMIPPKRVKMGFGQ
jgi:hypothetical protein